MRSLGHGEVAKYQTSFSHGVSLCLQKGNERRNEAGAVQSDISRFFDRFSPLRVASFGLRHGADAQMDAAAFFFCVSVGVRIRKGDGRWDFRPCSTGSLTGT